MALSVGEILQHRYRIVDRLGQGGMGAVYRAWDTRLDVAVALKEMIPQPGLDSKRLDDLRRQFQQEAQILARLNHPNLVRVSDFFQQSGNVYLVMDFVEGESLVSRIRREGAVSESQVLAWTEQLLSALAYCHSEGIIHRDVKPHNVIIRRDDRAVLVDFGLVKLWDPGDPRTRTAIHAMGTPEYAPPEQYDTHLGHTGPRSDVYSLGATMYHALTGQAPNTATSRMASPEAFPSLRKLAPRVSRPTETAVMRALELARSRRWRDAHEMSEALGVSIPAGPPVRPSPAPSVERQRTRPMHEPTQPSAAAGRGRIPGWVWATGGLVVVALILGGAAVAVGLRGRQGGATPPPTATEARTRVAAEGGGTSVVVITSSPTPVQARTNTPGSSPTASVTATATPTPRQGTPTPQETSTPSPVPTNSPTTESPTSTSQPTAAPSSGALITFERWSAWRRGDQPYGELTQTQEQVRSGSYAARLDYDFPATDDDFVVFVRELQLGGQPNTIGAWVYGDGSGHYVNSWIKDAQGEIWSVHLGKVGGSGWRQLAGRVDSERGWPSGHVAGPENGAVDYPIRFHALVLDRVGAGPTSGRIYVDDISVWQSEAGTTGTPEAATTATSATGEPTPEATSEAPVSEGPLDFPQPTQLDAWEGVEDGHRVTIVVHITGGAPPFTIYHDGVEIETTQERDYPLVFTVGGCTLTHTITVESADGQSVSHDYFIRGPWCD